MREREFVEGPLMKDRSLFWHWPTVLFLLASLVWATFVGWRAYSGWPSMPIDIDGGDPDVMHAYRASVLRHMLIALFLGVVPPSAIYAIARRVSR
jgi:hypothetical protein